MASAAARTGRAHAVLVTQLHTRQVRSCSSLPRVELGNTEQFVWLDNPDGTVRWPIPAIPAIPVDTAPG